MPESLDKGEAFHQAVFKAYFADGRNIAKISLLAEIAQSVGLKGAEEVIFNGIFKEAVDSDWKYSHTCGVTAVPTFVAKGRMAVGAQPYRLLEKLIIDKGPSI